MKDKHLEDPPDCDPEVYKHGKCVMITHSIDSKHIEWWVKQVASRSGQRVDWHWFGGRAVVKAIGDLDKVRDVIQAMMPELEQFFPKGYLFDAIVR